MIEPAVTSWPSPALTPSRWPTLSRPFFEVPPAFLWAMSGVLLGARARTLRRGHGLALRLAVALRPGVGLRPAFGLCLRLDAPATAAGGLLRAGRSPQSRHRRRAGPARA